MENELRAITRDLINKGANYGDQMHQSDNPVDYPLEWEDKAISELEELFERYAVSKSGKARFNRLILQARREELMSVPNHTVVNLYVRNRLAELDQQIKEMENGN